MKKKVWMAIFILNKVEYKVEEHLTRQRTCEAFQPH